MAFKDWFRGGRGDGSDPESVDDLIAAGELERAERHLKARIKANGRDLHSRLKLAELLMRTRRRRDAIDEYLAIADAYGRDGFFDKATALLRKIARLAEGDQRIALKIEALQRLKVLERRRDLVTNSLLERFARGDRQSGSSAFEIQKLWNEIIGSPLIERLSDDQLRRLFGAMELVRFQEGERLVAKEERREEILLLAHGQVEARVTLRSGKETALRSFAAGDLVGDRSLLEHKPWPAAYVAVASCVALRLTRDGLAEALTGESDPKGFLDALRAQGHDHTVSAAVSELSPAS